MSFFSTWWGQRKGRVVRSYTGSTYSWTVPVGVRRVQIKCWGAGGGRTASFVGGMGGFVSGLIDVTPGTVLVITVGGKGGDSKVSTPTAPGPGGWPGGGDGGTGRAYSINRCGAGGGGYSAVAIGTTKYLIAAGGGGAASTYATGADSGGGDGGAATGEAGDNALGGKGGTQTAGGAAGYLATAGSSLAGGTGASDATSTGYAGGGGAAGYYGGGGGGEMNNQSGGGGGGGSNFVHSACYKTQSIRGNNSTDPDWASGIGAAGGHGRVVILY
jgi:trimeric autotransporter adhesin